MKSNLELFREADIAHNGFDERYTGNKSDWRIQRDTVTKQTHKLVSNRSRYEEIGEKSGMPWWAVGIIHALESSFNFNAHMHNGDSLSARTVRVPAGRPLKGNPPFTFEESAIDAFGMKKFDRVDWEDLGKALDAFEGYNGLGYKYGPSRGKYPPMPSPYLFSMTNVEVRGKYSHDGVFDSILISQQVGVVAFLKRLLELGLINFDKQLGKEPDKEENTAVPAEQTWIEIIGEAGEKPSIYACDSKGDANFGIQTNVISERNAFESQFPNAKTFNVPESDKKPHPLLGIPEKEIPSKVDAKTIRQKVIDFASAEAAKGRYFSGGNQIDVKVLDPIRPALHKLGQWHSPADDGFWDWCAAWVTYVLREQGIKIPDQFIVKGKKYWATIALVEAWKAWAVNNGAWKRSRDALPGDVLCFNWNDDAYQDHIGICLKNNGSSIYTAEGNSGNREVKRYRNHWDIDGAVDLNKLAKAFG